MFFRQSIFYFFKILFLVILLLYFIFCSFILSFFPCLFSAHNMPGDILSTGNIKMKKPGFSPRCSCSTWGHKGGCDYTRWHMLWKKKKGRTGSALGMGGGKDGTWGRNHFKMGFEVWGHIYKTKEGEIIPKMKWQEQWHVQKRVRASVAWEWAERDRFKRHFGGRIENTCCSFVCKNGQKAWLTTTRRFGLLGFTKLGSV